MSEHLLVPPTHPQPRLIRRAVEHLRGNGLIVYPTDSCYAFGWSLGNRDAQDRVHRLRELDRHHNFTLVCADLAQVGTYAKVDNQSFRLIRSLTPGPYTFILPATNALPRRLRQERKQSLGVRIPDHPVAQALLAELGEPLTSSTLLLNDPDEHALEPEDQYQRLQGRIECFLDAGPCGSDPTTVIDLLEGHPRLVRQGVGPFESA